MGILYCRLESATCQPLPPGLARGATSVWTCIPDVYNELSDPGTSLNDCDCNCGAEDPDCSSNFNNMYCDDVRDSGGSPLPLVYGSGYECIMSHAGATCSNQGTMKNSNSGSELDCPQLPEVSPRQLAKGRTADKVPSDWTCDPALYYQLDTGIADFSCDCGCGIIDPDCGFNLESCTDQSWNPTYTSLNCNGSPTAVDLSYCRLESATCNLLPPGLARGHTAEWKCIPDVYNEMADPGTSLNDCDCNCGGFDPDCNADFNDLYCVEAGAMPIPRSTGIECASQASGGVACMQNVGIKLEACAFGSFFEPDRGVCATESWVPITAIILLIMGALVLSVYMKSPRATESLKGKQRENAKVKVSAI